MGLAERVAPRRLRRILGAAGCVRERWAFAARELRDANELGRYHLRGSDLIAHVRHPVLDMWVLEEVFRFHAYEPPPEVRARLARLGRAPRILDLGGHVGYFGLFAIGMWPEARITAFEPDPSNREVLMKSIEANRLGDRWTVVPACAGRSDGTTVFASAVARPRGSGDASLEEMQRRIGVAFEFMRDTDLLHPTEVEVEVRDVFPHLRDADLVKIDIEGAEWELFEDPRFRELQAAAMVLEYHPVYGHEADAEEVLRKHLSEAGFVVAHMKRETDAGLAWAYRPDAGG